MMFLVIAALIRAVAAVFQYCDTDDITGNITQAINGLNGVVLAVSNNPANVGNQVQAVILSVHEIAVSSEECIVDGLDELSVGEYYEELEPAVLSLTGTMTGDVLELVQYNVDGAITDGLSILLSTLQSTTAILALADASEASVINGVGSTVSTSLSTLIQLLL